MRCPFVQSRVPYALLIAEHLPAARLCCCLVRCPRFSCATGGLPGATPGLGFDRPSLTVRAGLAGQTAIPLFEPACFDAMLHSPPGFPFGSGVCPEGNVLNLLGLLTEISGRRLRGAQHALKGSSRLLSR